MKSTITTGVFFLTLFGAYAQEIIKESGDLQSKIAALIAAAPSGTDSDYQIPDNSSVEKFEQIFEAIINEDYQDAVAPLATMGYELVEFSDNDSVTYYIVQRGSSSLNYWGNYIINNDGAYVKRPRLILQAPHIFHDSNTGYQAGYIFEEIGARALFLSGTHRCNNSTLSSCSGTTEACGAKSSYRISDMAHNENSIFHTGTQIFYKEVLGSVFIQLHGFAKSDTDPYLIMSNGTHNSPDGIDYLSTISEELQKVDPVLDSKIVHIDKTWTRLAAITNVQGRWINGMLSPCENSALENTGRFIHIEQEKSRLRASKSGWDKMKIALANTFEETDTGIIAAKKKVSEITVYPNPFSDHINYDFGSQKFKVTVLDMLGRVVYQSNKEIEGAGDIDMSFLNSGTFILKLSGAQGQYQMKVLVKH